MRDAVGGDSLGISGMGFALPFCPGSFRALCRQAGQTTQEDNRVGLAAAPDTKALVPQARDSDRRRSRLRFLEAPRSLPQALQSDHLVNNPLALGCCSLRPGPATTPPSDRETAPQRRALAQSF